jgi:hypothetical protein
MSAVGAYETFLNDPNNEAVQEVLAHILHNYMAATAALVDAWHARQNDNG